VNKKIIFIGIIVGFFIMGFLSLQRAMPEEKEERIYKAIKVYSPYKLEKRIGGLTIIDSRDGRKEKPSPAEVYWRLDELEKEWAVKHLRLENSEVVVIGDNNQSIVNIHIENEKEMSFVKSFYGI
jgi:hypothetical protein